MDLLRRAWRIAQKRYLFLSGYVLSVLLAFRLAWRTLFPPRNNTFHELNSAEIPVYVINLKRRTDRLIPVLDDLGRAGFTNVHVIEAIDGVEAFPHLERGHAANLGCTLSHNLALRQGLQQGTPVAICEDDNEFFGTASEIHSVIRTFLNSAEYDVLALSARVRGRKVSAEPTLSIVSWALAPAFYVAKPRSGRTLLRSFRISERKLKKQRRKGPFDQVWRSAQRFALVFAVPKQPLARQRASFSDIQGKFFAGT